MSPVITFIIIAIVLYTIFKPRSKPDRTSDPTVPRPGSHPGPHPGSYPGSHPGPHFPEEGNTQRKTMVEQRMREQGKGREQGFSEKSALDDRFGARKAAFRALDPEPSPVMYKKAAGGTLLRMERASIVQGFIWSQVLGDPACKRPPGAYRRGGVP